MVSSHNYKFKIINKFQFVGAIQTNDMKIEYCLPSILYAIRLIKE